MTTTNAIEAALADLRVASALLTPAHRHGIVGVDLRNMTGGAAMLRHESPAVQDTYAGAIDAGLARLPGLTNRGYVLVRAARTEAS